MKPDFADQRFTAVGLRTAAAGLLALLLIVCLPALSAESVLEFESPADEARYAELLEGYRCLKCQNQSLADSRASLALDLRREIYERVIAGEPRAAIDEYLVARYGEFVLYRPRLGRSTLLLWIGPFVLLGIGLVAAWQLSRRSGQRQIESPSATSLAEARRLLDE